MQVCQAKRNTTQDTIRFDFRDPFRNTAVVQQTIVVVKP